MGSNVKVEDVVVVGAGAAGLTTAIVAARTRPDLRAVVLDGAKKIGAKILVSGGGRCNVTNVRVQPGDFRGGHANAIRNVLRAFTEKQAVTWFQDLGVSLHEEEHGKLFPDSNDAQTVLTALLVEAKRRSVTILTEHRVTSVATAPLGFEIHTGQGIIAARHLVLATGGKSLPKTGSDGAGYELARTLGHSIIDPVPALVPLILDGDFHAGLSGIAHDVTLTVRVEGEKAERFHGALLWTHFGVSGPVVLDASGTWTRTRSQGRSVHVSVNMLPAKTFDQAEAWFVVETGKRPREALRHLLSDCLPQRVADAMLLRARVEGRTPLAQVTRESRRQLVHALLEFPLPVIGDRGYNVAEVTAGGVPLDEVNVATMESRIVPRLFLVGEILNVDGRIGGYNFQWAWSTGVVAGRALGAAQAS